MATIGTAFRDWVLAQHVQGATPVAVDHDHIRIETATAVAEVNLYPYEDGREIAEYRISRVSDGEPVFFLHVMLDDLTRAQELFGEMVEALAGEADYRTTKILLCCTSALTTSMFAAKMNDVAKAIALDYEFTALPIGPALTASDDYAAVLLAPQAGYVRQKMAAAHPDALVFEIPGKIFGSYDAASAVRLLMHAMRETNTADVAPESLKAVRGLTDNHQVLIITLFSMRDYASLGYRIYDRGAVVSQGSVRKPKLDFRDVEDLVETLFARNPAMKDLDAIGIAVPGVTCRGVVTLENFSEEGYDLGRILARRFGIPAYLDNNCNAAAVGCYVSQEKYESLVFFRHAFGHPAGGFGTVIDGKLLKGRGNLAGEPKYYERRFAFDTDFESVVLSESGMHLLAEDVVLSAISLISPEAVYLAVDTIDDGEEFRRSLAKVLGDEYAPPVHIVNDYVERVYLGELAMAMQKLRDPYYRSLGVGMWHGIAPRAV